MNIFEEGLKEYEDSKYDSMSIDEITRGGFMDALKEEALESDTVLTENGAIGYASAGTALVDFNFAISSLCRSKSATNKEERLAEINKKFGLAYNENKEMAVRLLFNIGDMRQGHGERDLFNDCFEYICKNNAEMAKVLIKHIPEYARWDMVANLVANKNNVISNEAGKVIKEQLEEDLKAMKENRDFDISLMAKWLPKENTQLAGAICFKLGGEFVKEENGKLKPNRSAYRKQIIAPLRDKLNVIERNIAAQTYGDIDYNKIPSKAHQKYVNLFLKYDNERYMKYIEGVIEGKGNINASVIAPYEIIMNYTPQKNPLNLDFTAEAMWAKKVRELKETLGENSGKILMIRDGSGSMTWDDIPNSKARPIDIATALTLLTAETLEGEWKNKFITFSSYPEIVDVSNARFLKDKLAICNRHSDCSNTDIKKTFELVLNTAVKGNYTEKDMPETMVIISDMEFDAGNFRCPLFKEIEKDWEDKGYKLPKLVFWNVTSRTLAIPMRENENGVVLMSGFNEKSFDMVLNNELDVNKLNELLKSAGMETIQAETKDGKMDISKPTPEQALFAKLINERYDAVGLEARAVIEKEREIKEKLEKTKEPKKSKKPKISYER